MAEPAIPGGGGGHYTEIESFLESLYGEQEGYVYTPTKDAKSGFWQQYFFQWPVQKKQIITHLLAQTNSQDCYVAPSLFKAPSDKKSAWKGTNYLWTEFDGNAPKNPPDGIPSPSIRIQSSKAGHEHWYWRLDSFETDHKVVEGLTKRLAYTLDADKSVWDCSQVLRPPGTIHRHSKQRVRLLSSVDSVFNYGAFGGLVDVDENIVASIDPSKIPPLQAILLKYKWTADAIDLFNKKVPKGKRSEGLSRLGYDCFEMGMTREEVFAVLNDTAKRWNKFYDNRTTDKAEKEVASLVAYCERELSLRKALHVVEDEFAFDFEPAGEFIDRELKVDWLFDGFMQKTPLAVIASLPGVGKSTMGMRLGACLVLGQKFLIWNYEPQYDAEGNERQLKVGFISLEMDEMESRAYMRELRSSMTLEEQAIFNRNFLIVPLGFDLELDDPKLQQLVLEKIVQHNLDFIIIDSVSAAVNIDEKKQVKNFYQWIRKDVRGNLDVGVLLIHHLRKTANGSGDEEPKISDLYGDLAISRLATSAWGLHETGENIKMVHFKGRLAPKWKNFKIKREIGMTYSLLAHEKEENSALKVYKDNLLKGGDSSGPESTFG